MYVEETVKLLYKEYADYCSRNMNEAKFSFYSM